MKHLPGVLFGIVLGAAWMGLVSNIGINQAIRTVAAQYAVYALAGAAVIVALAILYIARDQIARKLFRTTTKEWDEFVDEVSAAVDEVADQRYGELKDRLTELSRSVVATITLWTARLALMRVMIALFVAGAGAFGTYVLIQQNDLIANQTITLEAQRDLAQNQVDLVRAQNELLNDQTQIALIASHLQTAARRSIYTPQVTEIITEVSQQFERFIALQSEEQPREYVSFEEEILFGHFYNHGILVLPTELVQRIRRLLPLLTPYVVVDITDFGSDQLSNLNNIQLRYVSPERGIILKSLLDHSVSLQDFISEMDPSLGADFSFADMRGYNNAAVDDVGDFDCVAQEDEHTLYPPYFPRPPETLGGPEVDENRWRPYLIDLTGLNLESADFSGAILENVRFDFGLDTQDYSHWDTVSFSQSIVNIQKYEPGGNSLPDMHLFNATTWFYIDDSVNVFERPFQITISNACPQSIRFDLTRERFIESNLLNNFVFSSFTEDGPADGWSALIRDLIYVQGEAPLAIERVDGVERRDDFALYFTPSEVSYGAVNSDPIE